jgi:carbon-monoxide dehydrogenase iron sulfur subunit
MKLILNEEKCTGCKICELICSATHQGVFNTKKTHIKIIVGTMKTTRKRQLKSCTLCLSCTKNCLTGAITFNNKWLVVNSELCTNCGQCVDVCPEGVIFLNNDGKVEVPDFCQGNPSCIEWCPHQAISKEEEAA